MYDAARVENLRTSKIVHAGSVVDMGEYQEMSLVVVEEKMAVWTARIVEVLAEVGLATMVLQTVDMSH